MGLFQKRDMVMVVGLGNPGKEYEGTRHNVGFRTISLVAEKLGVKIDRLRFQALIREVTYHDMKLLLVEPQTYMNLSGAAVGALASYYKIPPEKILVIFDDISLPVGRIRLRAEGSAGGHNGVKSIIKSLGTEAFPRIKIGVGAKPHPDYDLADWVLGHFSAEDAKALADRYPDIEAAARLMMDGKLGQAQNKYNR